MEQTVKQRLILFLKERKLSQREFSERVGLSSGYVNAIRNSIQPKTIHKIALRFPDLNTGWLLTGEGEMLKPMLSADPLGNYLSDSEVPYDRLPYLITKCGTKYYKQADGRFKMVVPFIPVRAYAGYADDHRDAVYIETLEEREFYVDDIHHGKYFAFEIKGDSMDNDSKRSLSDRDVVLARELAREHWRDGLRIQHYGAWIIVLKNTILCKQIITQDLEKGIITCHSLNESPEYSDFTLAMDDIRQLLNIVKKESSY